MNDLGKFKVGRRVVWYHVGASTGALSKYKATIIDTSYQRFFPGVFLIKTDDGDEKYAHKKHLTLLKPKPKKKTVWVNVYKTFLNDSIFPYKIENCYTSKELAIKAAKNDGISFSKNYIGTVSFKKNENQEKEEFKPPFKLIPFDYKKYLEGYSAISRCGLLVATIGDNKLINPSFPLKVYFMDDCELSVSIDGRIFPNGLTSIYDLFLIHWS
jgi:hypothetical protein